MKKNKTLIEQLLQAIKNNKHDTEKLINDALDRSLASHATDNALGPNPFIGFQGKDVGATAKTLVKHSLLHPRTTLQHLTRFIRDEVAVLKGRSDLAPAKGDRRFADPTWSENLLYQRGLQTYLTVCQNLESWITDVMDDPYDADRSRYLVSLLTDALAPSNWPTNPQALKRLLETGGGSAINGIRNLVGDIRHNSGMPSQVDRSKFEVGKNLATSPGMVVFKNEVLELIQYQPKTAQIHARPILIGPPPINRFYIFDLSPSKSLVNYAVNQGFSTFAISWRNPTKAHKHWGFDTYTGATLEAIDVVREISGSDDVNIMGTCVGSLLTAILLGHLAAKGDQRIHTATMMVAVFDTANESQLGMFMTPESVESAKKASQEKGVLDGQEMGKMFAWLRPNELVWSYWVNNYLLGNAPPVFDLLYWNSDTTRLPAQLHGEILDFVLANPLKSPGQLTVLGTPIDLGKVTCDTYMVAGLTDHITPWRGVYSNTHLFGGPSEFILSSSGHMQSIINPPGNPKAAYFRNAELPAKPDEWLAGAQKHADSWWGHWSEWLGKHSGDLVEAPQSLGSEKNPPRYPAPGHYVFES